jgi:MFS family permease
MGAAMLMPNSLAILGAAFSGEAKGRAVGTWAAVGAMAGAIGPVIGGWLIDAVSWRAIFLVNLPLVAACLALSWRTLPADKRDDDRPLDWQGGLLATGGLGALTWGLTLGSGPDGWDAVAVGAAAAGTALLAAFVWVQGRRGDRAMMPLALFGSSSFIGLSLLTLLLYGALGGLLVLVPYVLIEQAGYSATAAGAALLPFPLVLALTSPAMGALAGRIGSRIPLTVGPVVVGAGFLLATRIGGNGGYWTTVLPAVLVIALGMAGAVAPLTTAVLSTVDKQHQGSASGFNSAIARTGGLAATALLGAVLAARNEALLTAFRAALVIGAAAAVAAGLSALLLIRSPPKR